jgi:hypothetical protein
LGPRHPPENAEAALLLIFGRTNPMFVNEINVDFATQLMPHCLFEFLRSKSASASSGKQAAARDWLINPLRN